MTLPKKAAKKAAKKPANQSAMEMPNLHSEKGKDRKDLRRAYERMGRVEVLQASLGVESAREAINGLGSMARTELESGHVGDAVDLLRAAEHLSFASLAAGMGPTGEVLAELEATIREYFAKLMERAAEHWSAETASAESKKSAGKGTIGGLKETYMLAWQGATEAIELGAFHQALEYARAAETLARVKLHGHAPPKKLKRAAATPKPRSPK